MDWKLVYLQLAQTESFSFCERLVIEPFVSIGGAEVNTY